MTFDPYLTKRIGYVFLLLGFLSACAQPAIQTGDGAEVIGDNLHKVDNANAKALYLNPDIDFSRYKKILLTPLISSEVTIVQPSRSKGAREFVLSEEDKQALATIYQQQMRKYLPENDGFQVVTEAGTDVLQVVTAVIALAPSATNDDGRSRAGSTSARSKTYTEGGGSITLGLTLLDSESGKQLMQMVDQHSSTGTWQANNRVTNRQDLTRVFTRWATRLREGLKQVDSLPRQGMPKS